MIKVNQMGARQLRDNRLKILVHGRSTGQLRLGLLYVAVSLLIMIMTSYIIGDMCYAPVGILASWGTVAFSKAVSLIESPILGDGSPHIGWMIIVFAGWIAIFCLYLACLSFIAKAITRYAAPAGLAFRLIVHGIGSFFTISIMRGIKLRAGLTDMGPSVLWRQHYFIFACVLSGIIAALYLFLSWSREKAGMKCSNDRQPSESGE